MASYTRTLYAGVTNNITRRAWEHREGLIPSFTKRYRIRHLVWYEPMRDVRRAIAREKEIKGWVREKKIRLIESQNPAWKDLAELWFPAKTQGPDSSLPTPPGLRSSGDSGRSE